MNNTNRLTFITSILISIGICIIGELALDYIYWNSKGDANFIYWIYRLALGILTFLPWLIDRGERSLIKIITYSIVITWLVGGFDFGMYGSAIFIEQKFYYVGYLVVLYFWLKKYIIEDSNGGNDNVLDTKL